MKLKDLLISYRESNNLSQRQFAQKCKLSNGYISMLEKNINPKTGRPIVPSLTAMLAISKAMGITIDELLAKVDDLFIDISLVNNSEQLDEYIELYLQLSKEQQKLIIAQLKGILSEKQ